ncbi:hypothetical protein PYW08_009012 [Mythimna loreyi]|uniref:Uncharacterized protein n=1 Tax=Mythimna loreyi TaxID=667449 RepID=A0ACC2Q7B9_9NEOP|nr:hypothetical protein PYW08_009012 [Mythimna loreyi]
MCKLVKAYKDHDCLWDVTNEDYKNKEVRENAYYEICTKLNIPGLTVTDIPQKIKNFRTSYGTELRKIENSIRAGGKVYEPKLAWFSIAQEIFSNDSTSQLDGDQNVDAESELESNDTKTNEGNTQTTINTKISPQTTPENSEPQKRYEEDEFDVYGKYIAMCLRAMPTETSIVARMELQQTLANIQLKALKPRKSVEMPDQSGPSTSKMVEDPLHDPLDNIMVDVSLTQVKVEVDDD